MTITDDIPPIESPDRPPPSEEPVRLHRSRKRRLVAGVAGGVAERFDIDVTIVRIAFVVLTCLWGLGAAVYLAMWALVPTDADAAGPEPAEDARDQPTGPPWLTYLLLTGALFIGLIFSSAWWGGPQWGGGLGFLWLLVLFAVVVVAMGRPAHRLSVGRVFLALALVAVSVVVVATGAFLGAVALSGVPLTGGVGQRIWQPSSIAQLQPDYRTAIGSMTVDLTHVAFGSTTTRLTASVGAGLLVVDVPSGVVVDVSAHSGIGSVTYGSSGEQSFESPGASASSIFGLPRPQLDLTAEVGIGRVELERNGS
ncbi:MAG: PspC domain-containing protein [Acidimicrobiales bacterium]